MKKFLPAIVFLIIAVVLLITKLAETPTQATATQLSPLVGRPIAFASSDGVAIASKAPGGSKPKADLPVRTVGADTDLIGAITRPRDKDASLAIFAGSTMPAPLTSFAGVENLDNGMIHQLWILPPDMNGDVGPNHYFQVVNSLLRVYNKNGTPASAPFKISVLFEPLGTVCSTRNDGLAIVQYDQLADRWLISQTCTAFPPFRQMIAVSKTGDPLGGYYAYEFVMPNVKLNDFPKFGVWPDAYYMSTDEYLGSDYVGAGAFAFDRKKILAGDPTASYLYFNLQVPIQPRRKGLLPADLDGLRLPPAGAPNIFASYTATEYGDAQDAIRLYNFHADFDDPLNSTLTERPESPIAVAAFDPTSPDGRQDITQPPPGEFLDSQSDRLNYRLAYRNLGTSESLVVNQTVRTSPLETAYRAGVRVYELRKTGSAFAVTEQTTIGTATESRWIAGVAQDNQGNLAVEYNFVTDIKQPSIYYTGKLATDPPGQFRMERPFITGTGVQKAFGWRWGEYSGINVDPVDDCTFWITNAYYTLQSQELSDFAWLTRIGSFKFDECTAAPRGAITGSVTNSVTSQPVEGAVVAAAAYTRAAGPTGSYGTLSVLPGTYTVTASARGFLPQTITVTVANGETLSRDFALQPVPIIENTSTQLSAESCAINGAPEPGETVTLSVSLQNSGVLSAANMTATLLPTGGVLNPGAAQNYGAMPPGGTPVTRPFSFTVAPNTNCGGVITLTFELRDGAAFIGNVTIPLQTGLPRIALQQNFDSVLVPNLPHGWLTSSTENHQLWRTATARNQSTPISLFSPAPHQVGVNEVVSPAFEIESADAEIRFKNWYELETTFLRNRLYDGSVLEIRYGDGDWQDILAAGGIFLSGGYDGTIDSCCQNPLGGRLGWSGRSGVNQTSEFITTRVKLPASAAGQTARLRWRVATDIGGFREGQYIDDLVVADGFVCECANTSHVPFDFDGDRKTDLSVVDLNTGDHPDYRVISSSTNQLTTTSWGTLNDKPANADFDGDGKTDFAVYRPSDGTWYVLRSSDGGFAATRFGLATDIVTPADYDGDGKADVAVWRPSNGVWFVLRSSDGQAIAYQFGLTGDRPVNGDFDGDGEDDIAVWRPSDGTWYVVRSSDGGFDINAFGLSGDIPVSGDYDGDGRADLAVFRPSTNIWYLNRSTAGFFSVQFGLTSDLPMQADFDGDSRADIAVFRPSAKVWYHLRSSDGAFSAWAFGNLAERPVPAIFIDR
jgi:hypothetical protein